MLHIRKLAGVALRRESEESFTKARNQKAQFFLWNSCHQNYAIGTSVVSQKLPYRHKIPAQESPETSHTRCTYTWSYNE